MYVPRLPLGSRWWWGFSRVYSIDTAGWVTFRLQGCLSSTCTGLGDLVAFTTRGGDEESKKGWGLWDQDERNKIARSCRGCHAVSQAMMKWWSFGMGMNIWWHQQGGEVAVKGCRALVIILCSGQNSHASTAATERVGGLKYSVVFVMKLSITQEWLNFDKPWFSLSRSELKSNN